MKHISLFLLLGPFLSRSDAIGTVLSQYSVEQTHCSVFKDTIIYFKFFVAMIYYKYIMCIILQASQIVKESNGSLTVTTNKGVIDNVDCVIYAVGRQPNTKYLGLEKTVCLSVVIRFAKQKGV